MFLLTVIWKKGQIQVFDLFHNECFFSDIPNVFVGHDYCFVNFLGLIKKKMIEFERKESEKKEETIF